MNTNKKIEWEFQADRAYLPLSYSINAFLTDRKRIRRYLDIPDHGVTGQLFYPNDVFWNKGFKAEVALKQIEHHKKEGNEYLWRMAKICENSGKKLIKDIKDKISVGSISNLSKKELEQLFVLAVEKIRDFSVFLIIPFSLENYLKEQITHIVKSVVGEDEIQNTITKLLLPIKINDSSKEGTAIWDLATEINKEKLLKNIFESKQDIQAKISSNYPEFVAKIDSFVNDYGWIHVRWFKGTAIKRTNIINRLQFTIRENPDDRLRELEDNKSRIKKFVEDFSHKYSLTKEQKDTIFLIKEYVYIRTYRTDILNQALYLFFPMLERIAKFLNLTIDEILYHSETELRKKLLEDDTYVNVNARKEMWALLAIDDEYKIYSGKEEVEKLKKDQGVSRCVDNVSEVNGQTAFNGKIQGRAKIVLDPNDISKVEKGDVLVAVMTFPSYIAAMEKAVAFVTDEGGILCHASIIAREMKKPCIISTKIATKVFKDGDLIEIDAEKGVVRKIML